MQPALEIIKKHLLSIICGVVALLSMAALAYPLSGMYSTFQGDITKRAADYAKAKNLLDTPRVLPIVQPGSDRTPLDGFPTEETITAGEHARDAVHQQSVTLLQRAGELNAAGHQLLLAPNILPTPGDRVFDYRKVYLDEIQKQFAIKLGAAAPPNADEVKAATDALHDQEVEQKIVTVSGKEMNREQLERDFAEISAKLPDQLRRDRATKFRLYLDQTALSVSAAMLDANKRPTPADVWYAQLALWVQEDVGAGIVAANNTIKDGNILSDPIKRIVRIDVAHGPAIYVLGDPSKPPGDDPAAARDYTKSPTGRYCNTAYDVVQFGLVLDIDQRDFPMILTELQRGRMTTVTSVNIAPVDMATINSGGYIFGNAPVVEVALTCESLFLRSWTLPLMPDEVKADLHISTDASGNPIPPPQ